MASQGSSPIRYFLSGNPLHRPAVAVGVLEVDEPAPREVLDLADVQAPLGEVRTRGLDVGNDELHALHRARLGVRESLPDRDRAVRAGRRELHEANLVADRVVVVGVEADLLVERLRAIHVGHGDRNELELVVHVKRRPLGRCGNRTRDAIRDCGQDLAAMSLRPSGGPNRHD